jgi:hypothetical protein
MDQQHVRVDERVPHERLDELAAAENDHVGVGLGLERRDRSRPVSLSSVELAHGNGSLSVVEATYVSVLFRASVKGLSSNVGQNPAKSKYVRRPRKWRRRGCLRLAVPAPA